MWLGIVGHWSAQRDHFYRSNYAICRCALGDWSAPHSRYLTFTLRAIPAIWCVVSQRSCLCSRKPRYHSINGCFHAFKRVGARKLTQAFRHLHVAYHGQRQPAQTGTGLHVNNRSMSMWISNTATILMMLPMAIAIINAVDNPDLRCAYSWYCLFGKLRWGRDTDWDAT